MSGPGLHTGRGTSSNLRTDAAMWPTPTARDTHGAHHGHTKGGRDPVTDAVMWPTPRARDQKGRDYSDSLPTIAGAGPQAPTTATPGQEPMVLNPPFVEWLMGWPIGWTDCTRSATASYRSWLRRHSSTLRAGLG
jgi:hypothetical protein